MISDIIMHCILLSYHGQGAPNELSRIYNNVVLHTNNAFMFLNKDDAEGQEYEFVHNTVYNFTGTGPIKLFCLSSIVGEVHPISNITMRNNIFALGQNAERFDQYGYKNFYGNTNGTRDFTEIIHSYCFTSPHDLPNTREYRYHWDGVHGKANSEMTCLQLHSHLSIHSNKIHSSFLSQLQ